MWEVTHRQLISAPVTVVTWAPPNMKRQFSRKLSKKRIPLQKTIHAVVSPIQPSVLVSQMRFLCYWCFFEDNIEVSIKEWDPNLGI